MKMFLYRKENLLLKKLFSEKTKAEMTVFFCLISMLLASFFFALLEVTRYHGLAADAKMSSVLETENIAAEFDADLWQEYGLFFVDSSYGTGTQDLQRLYGRVLSMAEKNLNPQNARQMSLYKMRMTSCNALRYEVATDDGGNAFRKQAVEYEKRNAVSDIAQTIREKLTLSGNTASGEGYREEAVESGKAAIEQAKAEREQQKAQRTQNGEPQQPEESVPDIEFENPLELFSILKANAVLAMVLPQEKTSSAKSISLAESIERRTLQSGNEEEESDLSELDQLIFLGYLTDKYGNFTNKKENRCLDYELEYLIAGKESDAENLEAVVNRILLQRCATNLLYLHTDAEKCEIAYTIATVLAGVTANPAIIAAVKEGILAAWAYVESLQDVRTLLSGGRISLIKTSAQWKTDVLHPATSFSGEYGANSTSTGFSYEDYLLFQIALESRQTVNYRAMNLIEQNVSLQSGRVIRMDAMMQQIDMEYEYEANTLFSKLITIGEPKSSGYSFYEKQSMSYVS